MTYFAYIPKRFRGAEPNSRSFASWPEALFGMPNWVRLGLWPEDLRVGAPPAETSQMVRLYRPSLSLQARRLRHPPPKAVSSTRGQPGPGAVAEATDTEEIPGDFGCKLGMGRVDHPVGRAPPWRAAYSAHKHRGNRTYRAIVFSRLSSRNNRSGHLASLGIIDLVPSSPPPSPKKKEEKGNANVLYSLL